MPCWVVFVPTSDTQIMHFDWVKSKPHPKKLTDLGVPQYLFNLCRRRGELADDIGEIEGRERQGSGCAPVPAQPPTVTFFELREPLLTD